MSENAERELRLLYESINSKHDVYTLRGNALVGLESLARLQNPDLGLRLQARQVKI
jgi:hypothetical protein